MKKTIKVWITTGPGCSLFYATAKTGLIQLCKKMNRVYCSRNYVSINHYRCFLLSRYIVYHFAHSLQHALKYQVDSKIFMEIIATFSTIALYPPGLTGLNCIRSTTSKPRITLAKQESASVGSS